MIMRRLPILAAAAVFTPVASSQLVINEVMQSNIDCIMDDIHEYPDSWVELYNAGTEIEMLGNYSILDKDKPKKAYKLPSYAISPGQYIVIYCDKEEKGLHTSFRLETTKEGSLYLYKDSKVVDRIEALPKMPAPNVAYGRKTDDASEWGYQLTPTPKAANCGSIVDKDKLLPDPVFSKSGSVNCDAFQLSLSIPEKAPEGSVIRYTTDGSEPTESSKIYSSPISVSKTTTVRAKIFADGYIPRRSLTHSYIFHGRDFTIPVVSMVTDNGYFFDKKEGIYENYEQDWRRPINLEVFMEEGKKSVINQLCETRIKGGATRSAALKSLALYANKRFGEKRFDYEFFPDEFPGLDDWKSLELRNSGNDFDYTYFRDAVIQRVMGMNCDLDWQPYLPTAFYLNGVYKGMLNLRTRSNEDLIYSLYNGLEDIDMVENNWELKEGSLDNWNAFKEFYTEKGHTFAEFEKWMDCGEFANLFIMNLVCDNKDWPGNNIVCWRPTADGGRWRWVAKDTDFGLGLYGQTSEYPTLTWFHTPGFDPDRNWGNTSDATRLFRRLMETPEFKEMFINRTAVYMGDFLTENNFKAEIDKMYDAIKYEYPHHRRLFNQWWPNHADEVNWMKTWIAGRIPYFYRHMAEFFGLGDPIPLQIDLGRQDDIKLIVNDVEMSNRSFNGRYFQNRQLRISAKDKDSVEGWEVTVVNGNERNTTSYDSPVLDIVMPEASYVSIVSKKSAGVSRIESDDVNAIDPMRPVEVYSLNGSRLGRFVTLQAAQQSLTGPVIIRQGSRSVKSIF